jgi:glycosyltransferase involved in cell wall biosynthesis
VVVSVVIPAYRRPKLLLRAINSVLRQTYQEIEVIVIVEKGDQDSASVLRSVDDPRFQVIVHPHSLTAAGARNIGADYATGEWIAFLDDDDEWMPTKLERQIALADGRTAVLVSCLSQIVTPTASYVQPEVIYDNFLPIDEYLLDYRSFKGGPGFIQTSSFLLPRGLFERVKFNIESAHDDWEFVLRLRKQAGARIETVPEVLVTIHHDQQPSLTTRTSSWLRLLDG